MATTTTTITATTTTVSWPIEDGWVLLPCPTKKEPLTSYPQRHEVEWLLDELHETLKNLKHGLEDCYALLAPVEPGSTLVVSTPRNELIKGHVTRIGTRIVKGVRLPLSLSTSTIPPLDQKTYTSLEQTLSLRLRTSPHQTYTINADNPIHLAPLTALHTLLTDSIDVLALTLSHTHPSSSPPDNRPPPSPTSSTAAFIAAQLRLLSQSLTEASSLLKGPQPRSASDATWVSKSCSPLHFTPAPSANLSVHWGVQDSSLVLWLRTLEPADAPVNFGMKFALAIGTARRLEHDEAEQAFTYTYPEGCLGKLEGTDGRGEGHHKNNSKGGEGAGKGSIRGTGNNGKDTKDKGDRSDEVQVFVREKVRVESADPSLLSLSAKLTALANTLSLARRNLAAVMGEEMED